MLSVLERDLRVSFRRWGELASPLVFFAMVATLMPLALRPDAPVLRMIGPAVLWVSALLSVLLSLNVLYRGDVEDGTMEQLLLEPSPLPLTMLAKALAHWLVSAAPLVVIAPLFAVGYDLPASATGVLCLSLLLGTPSLCFIGGIGAALTAGLRQAGGLLALLVLPLMMPVLIFGARATDQALQGDSPASALYLLGAALVLSFTLAPFAAAAGIRIALD
jgi:heme exporter protein B